MIITPSLQKRIYWGFAITSMTSMLLMLAAALLSFESLEQTMLTLDLAEESSFFLQHIDTQRRNDWQTASLTGVYIPDVLLPGFPVESLPAIFQRRPIPFNGELHVNSGERDVNQQTFLVSMQKTAEGQIYLAKNITLFERRENLFAAVLVSAVVLLLGMSLVWAKISGQSIIHPLQRLIRLIEAAKPNSSMPLLPLDWRERELMQIAICFNDFVSTLDQYMQRERQLLNMASHELRTPIAVIAGAAEILQQRQSLNVADQQVVQRILLASNEMRANIDGLLSLARHTAQSTDQPLTRIDEIIRQVVSDLQDSGLATERLVLDMAVVTVAVNPHLVKMLLQNLLRNALQHTLVHPIQIQLHASGVVIADQGDGMPASQQQRLSSSDASVAQPGLGLYVVTLICERIGWYLEVNTDRGTRISLGFPQKPNESQ